MTTVRSLLFVAWLYLSMAIFALLLSPVLLFGSAASMGVIKGWARFVLFGLRVLCGVRVEVRGLEHRPEGPALIAGKHQGMLDVIAPFTFLSNPCFVMKKELMVLPFFGWFAVKLGNIVVDRGAAAKALRKMLGDARRWAADGRQILIFPEGTRMAPGETTEFKPGVAGLYSVMKVPCVPVALNTGHFWRAHGILRKPGVATIRFLEPIAPGLPRDEFMTLLKQRIDTATAELDAAAEAQS